MNLSVFVFGAAKMVVGEIDLWAPKMVLLFLTVFDRGVAVSVVKRDH